ncbi:MAG: peptidoglycan-binding protein [Chitinophagales bacterium]|jgi:hypothetical protein|nr:peptidoglycan-binding protein [Chitinophagales bacterium]
MRNFKNLLLVLSCAASCAVFNTATVFAQGSDLPPNAVAGKCYAKCMAPDQYETVTEQILLKEASTRLEVVPAVYESTTEQVLVKEAYKVLEVVPATFTTQTEEIMVKEASKRLTYVPPVYETVSEQMLISPAGTKWTKGRADRSCLNEDPEKCKVWCLTEVPAQYKTVTKQVLRTPATTNEVAIPAEYKTISKAVVQNPANTREREVAAEYRTITKQVLKSPATTREIEEPAQYSTITTKKLVRAGEFTDWVEVLCDSKTTPSKISQIQDALRAKGYDPGPSDNVLGGKTRAALQQFQKDNNLPVGNLNMETMRALGVER